MRIRIQRPSNYSAGIHPEVTEIEADNTSFDIQKFLAGNRFPNLESLTVRDIRLVDLKLSVPSLKLLDVGDNKIRTLKLDCPSLTDLWCDGNLLTVLDLNCPLLELLICSRNKLTDLNGLEFCTELHELWCSETLKKSVKVLKEHLPNLVVEYQ